MKNFFKRLMFKEKKPKFLFTTKHLGRETGNGMRISTEERGRIDNLVTINELITWDSSHAIQSSGENEAHSLKKVETSTDIRKAVQPIEVFAELKKEDPGISFENLDEKIKVVEDRIEILKEHLDESHLADEHKSLFFLKNRKKYLKTKTKNPLDWAMTNNEAVKDLCSRYKLQVVPLKQYYTLVPSDGLKEMKRYTAAYKAITGDEPIYELVIKDTEAIKPEEKKELKKKDRDPILLANSPFANTMFVLGAWDDEVEIVDEIIYGGK